MSDRDIIASRFDYPSMSQVYTCNLYVTEDFIVANNLLTTKMIRDQLKKQFSEMLDKLEEMP